jgi:hypothetical protein
MRLKTLAIDKLIRVFTPGIYPVFSGEAMPPGLCCVALRSGGLESADAQKMAQSVGR